MTKICGHCQKELPDCTCSARLPNGEWDWSKSDIVKPYKEEIENLKKQIKTLKEAKT